MQFGEFHWRHCHWGRISKIGQRSGLRLLSICPSIRHTLNLVTSFATAILAIIAMWTQSRPLRSWPPSNYTSTAKAPTTKATVWWGRTFYERARSKACASQFGRPTPSTSPSSAISM